MVQECRRCMHSAGVLLLSCFPEEIHIKTFYTDGDTHEFKQLSLCLLMLSARRNNWHLLYYWEMYIITYNMVYNFIGKQNPLLNICKWQFQANILYDQTISQQVYTKA